MDAYNFYPGTGKKGFEQDNYKSQRPILLGCNSLTKSEWNLKLATFAFKLLIPNWLKFQTPCRRNLRKHRCGIDPL